MSADLLRHARPGDLIWPLVRRQAFADAHRALDEHPDTDSAYAAFNLRWGPARRFEGIFLAARSYRLGAQPR